MNIFGHLVYGTFGRHYCRRNGLNFLSPKWLVTKRSCPALAPSRLNQGSLCNPGTTATEAEARKIEKYRELIDNGYIFQPVALEGEMVISPNAISPKVISPNVFGHFA